MTQRTVEANAPIITSLCMHLPTRTVYPVLFSDESCKGPEISLRSVMSMFSQEKMLQVYDSSKDEFVFGANQRFAKQKYTYHCQIMPSVLRSVLQCSDMQILMDWSTSPLAEADDFPQHMRKSISFLLQYPDSTKCLKSSKVYSRIENSNQWKQVQ